MDNQENRTRKQPSDAEIFGERVRDLRRREGLTAAQLAEKVRSHQSRISDIENGKGYINALDLPLYAAALNTTVSFLATGLEPENEFVGHELGLSNNTINRLIHDQQQGNILYSEAINLFFDECDNPDSPFESAGETVLRLIYDFARCPEDQSLLKKVDLDNPLQFVSLAEIEQVRVINALHYFRKRVMKEDDQ